MLSWKTLHSNGGKPGKVLSQSSIWCPSPSRFPGTEEKILNNAVASSSRLTTTSTPSTYPLPPASSSLTTIHYNNSSGNLALGFIQTHRIPISSFFCIIQEEGMITRDNNCIRLLLAVPTVEQRLWRMVFYLLWFVSDAPRDHRQYHNEYDDSNLADETGES